MHEPPEETVRELDPKAVMPLVVGAHLQAELTDRELAYRLREHILRWQKGREGPIPVVCTDLWYLNNDELRRRPTIAVGPPERNAATAYLAGRLPTAFVAEDRFRIQFDPEFLDLNVCIWGATPRETAASVDLYIDRYLAEYLQSVHRMHPDAL